MQYTVLCIVLLAICEPILVDAKKVVVVLPRQVRRSPSHSWRSGQGYMKKGMYGGFDPHHHHMPYRGPPNFIYHDRKPGYRAPPFPHGGDDFDQGHEHVNHVNIPFGKDVTTVTTFGKGYVPYEYLKGQFSLAGERFPMSSLSHMSPMSSLPSLPLQMPLVSKPSGPDFSQSPFASGSNHQEYVLSQASPYASQHQNLFITGPDSVTSGQKVYTQRSIDKDLGIEKGQPSSQNSAAEREKEPAQRATDIFKDAPKAHEMTQGAIVLPSGIPAATIAGSKDGIVLRDSVYLDDYHRKVEELTKNWPATFMTSGSGAGPAAGFQHHQLIEQYPTTGMAGSSYPGATLWLSEFAQSKQGYAVKEDVMEQPHDFRMVPIQTTMFQSSIPTGMNFGLSSQGVHGR